jgi:hypothetical protein
VQIDIVNGDRAWRWGTVTANISSKIILEYQNHLQTKTEPKAIWRTKLLKLENAEQQNQKKIRKKQIPRCFPCDFHMCQDCHEKGGKYEEEKVFENHAK